MELSPPAVSEHSLQSSPEAEVGAGEPSLVELVLEGDNRALRLHAAGGVLPLPQEELISLQVQLAGVDDSEVAETAKRSLRSIDRSFLLQHLQTEAGIEVVRFFALHSEDPNVLERVLQRRELEADSVAALAQRVDADLQEIILLRQDLIVERPAILEALEQNPRLSRYCERLIGEYREHLLGGRAKRARDDEERRRTELEQEQREEDELQRELERVRNGVEVEGEFDEQTGLSEGQIRELSTSARLKLAAGASRSLRAILIRDPSPQVAIRVLTASAVTEGEIEQFTRSRRLSEEVLIAIAENRDWSRRYRIVANLVKNPRTPPGIAIKFLSRLSVRELGTLRFDRNVPEAVRQGARRLYEARYR